MEEPIFTYMMGRTWLDLAVSVLGDMGRARPCSSLQGFSGLDSKVYCINVGWFRSASISSIPTNPILTHVL